MGTTDADIRVWLDEAPEGCTHMIVVVDQFEWEDYPVYVMPGQDPRKIVAENYSGQNMQSCVECYSFAKDLEAQLNEWRARHFD